MIIQISRFKLHHAVHSPRPSEPSINRNVGWLCSHNMRGVLLFKIISQCALPNSWATYGQYVSGDFVLLHQVVAESSRLFVIKQRLTMLNDALISSPQKLTKMTIKRLSWDWIKTLCAHQTSKRDIWNITPLNYIIIIPWYDLLRMSFLRMLAHTAFNGILFITDIAFLPYVSTYGKWSTFIYPFHMLVHTLTEEYLP